MKSFVDRDRFDTHDENIGAGSRALIAPLAKIKARRGRFAFIWSFGTRALTGSDNVAISPGVPVKRLPRCER
jgi:hypothetical protein